MTRLALLLLCASCVPAHAQDAPTAGQLAVGLICQPFDKMVANLEGKFHEHVVGIGVQGGSGFPIALYRSEAGTFSVLIVTPDGKACFAAVGEGWEDVAPPPKGDPA